MILQFFVWFLVFVCMGSLFIASNPERYRYMAITIFALVFFAASAHERLQYYLPISGIPNPEINFNYNHHKTQFIGDELFVFLWITNIDTGEEMLYNFPYEDNEDLKRELDGLRDAIQQKRRGAGAYRINQYGDPNDGNEEDFDFIIDSEIEITIQKETNE